jgi:hypothetical protein
LALSAGLFGTNTHANEDDMAGMANAAGPKSSFRKTFRKIMFFLILFRLYDAFLTPPLTGFTVDENGDLSFHQNEYPFWHQVK